MRILLVEDSDRLRQAVQTGLRKSGFAVDAVADGKKGLSYAANNPYDVVVLDLMLPEMDGLTLLRQLRREGKNTHVLILSAKDTVEDRVAGFQAGADDYLVKPFAFQELVERIRALVRRRYDRKDPEWKLGTLRLEVSGLVAEDGTRVTLTQRERAFLEYLAARADEDVSTEEIEDALYDEHTLPEGNAIQSIVSRLRGKLKDIEGAPRVDTVRGHGYRLSVPRA